MDAMRESTGERLRNLCRRSDGNSNGEFEEIKEAGSERMDGLALHPKKQERSHNDAGSKEDAGGDEVAETEREDEEDGKEEDSASEESDENTVTDTEIEQVESSSERDSDVAIEKEWAEVGSSGHGK